jgi:putative lipoic acid-binding regulatory protein
LINFCEIYSKLQETKPKKNSKLKTQNSKLMDKPGGNGNGKVCNTFNRQSVNYPVKFDLKVIIDASIKPKDSISAMEGLFKKYKVPFSDWRQKSSSGGKYISYTVSVDIDSQEMLEKLYTEMKQVPGLKFAL